jgi:hypothetical protein
MDLVYINDFCVNSRTCALTISVSAVESDCIDNFWVDRDSVLVNDF